MRKHNIHSILLSLPLLALTVSGCGGEGFEPVDAGEVVSFSVSERIPTLREKTATKAPKVYTGAAADVQALDFSVWAYNMPSAGSLPADWRLDGGTGSTPVKASYNSEKNDWRPAGNIKYNSSSRAATWQARWFALGPWAACNGSTANVSGLTPADGSAPRPRYTVPSGRLVSTRHYDLLAAVSADRAVGTTTPVALNFCHVLTGIRFKREKDLNITDITVSGVYDRADLAMEKIPADGDLTAFVNVDNEGDDADLWSGRTRSVATPSFSMAPASWTNGRPGNPAAETQWDYAAGDGDILMMIPQFTPAGAKITVTIDGVPVAGDISGHRWLPGRLVTYAITRGDDFLTWELSALGEDIIWENEYIFEGTVPATLSYPAEGGELTLATDFRSCIEDGEQAVPESFVFQYSADGTGDWTDGLPDWLSSPGTSLDGAATATTLSLTAAANDSGAARTVHVRLLQTNTGKVITPSCQITQQNVLNYILEGTVPATQSIGAVGGDITFAEDFLSYVNSGSTNTKEPFVLQYSADGSDWTSDQPDWLSPAPGTDLNGATTATTLKLRATSLANGGSLRSVYVRAYQPSTGKASAACLVRQLTSAYVNGRFSVSASKQVWFARGNLFVNVNANPRVWKFEDEQYGSSGYFPAGAWIYDNYYEDARGGYSVAGRGISHFGWATAGVKNGTNAYGYDVHHVYYEPGSIFGGLSNALYNNNYYGYGPSVTTTSPYVWAIGANLPFFDVVENSWNRDGLDTGINTVRKYCDWGVHFDDAGNGLDARTDGTWYTLSYIEWKYLLEEREDWSLLLGTGSIYDPVKGKFINGLIICPDNWATPSGCIFNPGFTNGWETNKYTAESSSNANCPGGLWSSMEEAGAVFLPAAGHRGSNRAAAGSWGFGYGGHFVLYWSSSAFSYSDKGQIAYSLTSNGTNAGVGGGHRSTGYSVRLVHD